MNHEFLKGIHVTKVITEDLLTLVRVTRIYSETGGHRLLQFHIIYYNLKYGALKEIIILHNARPSTLRLQNSELNRDLGHSTAMLLLHSSTGKQIFGDAEVDHLAQHHNSSRKTVGPTRTMMLMFMVDPRVEQNLTPREYLKYFCAVEP